LHGVLLRSLAPNAQRQWARAKQWVSIETQIRALHCTLELADASLVTAAAPLFVIRCADVTPLLPSKSQASWSILEEYAK